MEEKVYQLKRKKNKTEERINLKEEIKIKSKRNFITLLSLIIFAGGTMGIITTIINFNLNQMCNQIGLDNEDNIYFQRNLANILYLCAMLMAGFLTLICGSVSYKYKQYVNKSFENITSEFEKITLNLEGENKFIEKLIDVIPIGILHTTSDFTIQKVNSYVQRILGYQTSKLVGKKCSEIFNEEHNETGKLFLELLENMTNPEEQKIFSFKNAENDEKIIEIRKSRIAEDKNTKNSNIISFIDISNKQDFINTVKRCVNTLVSCSQETAGTIKHISLATKDISSTSENFSVYSNAQDKGLKDVVQKVQVVSKLVDKTNHHTQKMVGTSNNIVQLASKGKIQMNDTVNTINRTLKIVESTLKSNENLVKRSKEINKIVHIITEIADRTNLLALNASIEAARAGEYGRGFAVVADEVGNLAVNSKKSAKQISDLIQQIQMEIDISIEGVKKSNKYTEENVKDIEITEEYFSEIMKNINITNKNVKDINAGINLQNQVIQGIEGFVSNVSKNAIENSASAEELSASAEELSISMDEMGSNSHELLYIAEELEKEMKKNI
ncbi:MAG: PAS domain S-box protein [archaeon]|nr:PAS domain S-box protein [archaeon]